MGRVFVLWLFKFTSLCSLNISKLLFFKNFKSNSYIKKNNILERLVSNIYKKCSKHIGLLGCWVQTSYILLFERRSLQSSSSVFISLILISALLLPCFYENKFSSTTTCSYCQCLIKNDNLQVYNQDGV